AAARRGVRAQPEERGDTIEIEELRIEPREVQAYVDGQSAELTPTEFRLLYALALDRGRVTTRDELLQRIWGRRETHRDRTVDVFVRRLRDKIDRVAPHHTFIQTRYGVGYRLEPVSNGGEPGEEEFVGKSHAGGGSRPELLGRGVRRDHRGQVDSPPRPRFVRGAAALLRARALVRRDQPADSLRASPGPRGRGDRRAAQLRGVASARRV